MLSNFKGVSRREAARVHAYSWIVKYLLLLKLEVTPTNCQRREKGPWLTMKQPSRLRQSHFSTMCSFLSVCRYSPRYNNPLLLFVFFQAQAWRVNKEQQRALCANITIFYESHHVISDL